MNEAFSTVVAIILCVFLMIIVPIQNMKESNNRIEQNYIQSKITNFVESSRNTGIISKKSMEELNASIYSLLGNYKISILHSGHIKDGEEDIVYFADSNYNAQINEALEKDERYIMKQNDYLKVMVTTYSGEVVAIYSGGIKREGSSIDNEAK